MLLRHNLIGHSVGYTLGIGVPTIFLWNENCVATIMGYSFASAPIIGCAFFCSQNISFIRRGTMSIVQAKCTNCGANIEVDPRTEAGICPYCKTAYITQKAIVNYNTTIVNNNAIYADKVDIFGGNFGNFMRNAMECWEGNDYEGAFQSFSKALDLEPDNDEAALYRSLCLGWKEKQVNYKILLNVYHRVFDNVDFTVADADQVEKLNYFICELDRLNYAAVLYRLNQYHPEMFDTKDNIYFVWQGLEEGIHAQSEILAFSEKIKDKNPVCASNHVSFMKRLLDYYQKICIRWKHLMPLDYRYFCYVRHPQREEYKQKIADLIEAIKMYEPDFVPPATKSACVAAGTLITLADGRQVPVEELSGDEKLLVWDLFTGKFDSAPILFVDSEASRAYEVINLAFSDGTALKVIDEHALWDIDLNEYVFMRSDAAKYVGHWFNKQTYDAEGVMSYTRVRLTDVAVTEEYTSAWSPVTHGHLCFYVNGMLSMPGSTAGLINIFDVALGTMTIDEKKYLADIARYGTFSYEEFAAMYPVPEKMFNAFGGQNLKVAIGKGLLTGEMIEGLVAKYSKFFS